MSQIFKNLFSLNAYEPYNSVTLGKNSQTKEIITINQEQLESGGYLLGVQGVGKSSLLLSLILQQLKQRESVIVLDPHGSLIHETIARMPQERIENTYLLSLSEPEKHYFGMNIFYCKDLNSRKEKAAVRNLVMHAFERLWPETKNGLYFGNVLRPIISTLIEKQELTLAHVPRLFYDDNFRRHYTKGLENFEAIGFWAEYEAWSKSKRERYVDPLLDRVKKLLSDDIVRYILCQKQSKLDVGQLIRQRKNILLHLPLRDPVYEFAAPIIGTFFTTLLQGAVFGMSPDQRVGCTLVIDEFQNFVTEDNERFFSEGRKYKVKQILAHQYTQQLDKDSLTSMKAAATSAYTIVCFRTNTDDAPRMADLFGGLSRTPTDIYIDVLAHLDDDKNPARIKEFYWHTVKPLEEATRRAERPDTVYSFDFGYGEIRYSPKEVLKTMNALSELLYYSQKERRIDEGKLNNFLWAYGKATGQVRTMRVKDLPRGKSNLPTTVSNAQREIRELNLRLQSLEEAAGKRLAPLETTLQSYTREQEALEKEKTKRREAEERRQKYRLGLYDAIESRLWTYIKEDKRYYLKAGLFGNRFVSYPYVMKDDDNWYFLKLGRERNLPKKGIRRGDNLVDYWYIPKKRMHENYEYVIEEFVTGPNKVAELIMLSSEIERLEEWAKNVREASILLSNPFQGQPRLNTLEKIIAEKEGEIRRIRGEEADKRLAIWKRIEELEEQKAEIWEKEEFTKRLFRSVLELLIQQPLTADKSTISEQEIEQTLQQLPNRTAYVKVASQVYTMQTLDVNSFYPPRSDTVERRNTLIAQTKEKYCRGLRTIEAEIQKVYDSGQVIEPENKEDRQERPQANQAERKKDKQSTKKGEQSQKEKIEDPGVETAPGSGVYKHNNGSYSSKIVKLSVGNEGIEIVPGKIWNGEKVTEDRTKPTKKAALTLEDIWEIFDSLKEGDDIDKIIVFGSKKTAIELFLEELDLRLWVSKAKVRARFEKWYENKYHKKFSLREITVPNNLLNSIRVNKEIVDGLEVTQFTLDNVVLDAVTEKFCVIARCLTDEEYHQLIENALQTRSQPTRVKPVSPQDQAYFNTREKRHFDQHPWTGDPIDIDVDYDKYEEAMTKLRFGKVVENRDFWERLFESSDNKKKQADAAKREVKAKETNRKPPVNRQQKPKSGIDKLTTEDIID